MSQGTSEGAGDGTRDTLTITDNRTGKTYEVPIRAVRAMDLRQIKTPRTTSG